MDDLLTQSGLGELRRLKNGPGSPHDAPLSKSLRDPSLRRDCGAGLLGFLQKDQIGRGLITAAPRRKSTSTNRSAVPQKTEHTQVTWVYEALRGSAAIRNCQAGYGPRRQASSSRRRAQWCGVPPLAGSRALPPIYGSDRFSQKPIYKYRAR